MSRWIPLESNPDVLNAWAKKAGLVTSQDKFEDVYGLDPDLLGMVPKPVKAVILLFPITDALETKRKEEDTKLTAEANQIPAVDPTVFFIKQTISNACGTIGLLHALANSNVTIAPVSPLAKFIDQCKDKTPDERAATLASTPLFANIHLEAASSGQTAVPENLDTNLHFTCFVSALDPEAAADQIEGATGAGTGTRSGLRVIELDGRRPGPVDRGKCADLLKDVAEIVKNYYITNSSDISFSMLALCGRHS